jgi:hypothetical protein
VISADAPTDSLDARPSPSCGECDDAPFGCNGCDPGSHCPLCKVCWAAGEYCGHAAASDAENAAWEAA